MKTPTRHPSSTLFRALCLAAFALLGTGLLASTASAAPAPAFKLSIRSLPTNFIPGETPIGGFPTYSIVITNIGALPSSPGAEITDTLPLGLTEHGTGDQMVTALIPSLPSSQSRILNIPLDVSPDLVEGTVLHNQASITGGGAPPTSVSTETLISSVLPSFEFLPGAAGLSASLTDDDGTSATAAGSHPYQLTVDLGFPGRHLGSTEQVAGSEGGLRDATTTLPPGVIVNPAASPLRCTEALLETDGCPDDAAVGVASILTSITSPQSFTSALYSLEPAPGAPAEFGFNALGIGVFVHLKGGLRAGRYTLSASSSDALARAPDPVLAVQVQLWGDISDPSHDRLRGNCVPTTQGGQTFICRATEDFHDIPFISMPTACTPSLMLEAEADSWAAPTVVHSTSAPFSDYEGNSPGVSGCNALDFSPTLTARPTTNLIDSPSGLDVDLHVPQSESLLSSASAHLKDATVTLPEGMAVNPSQADGLLACSSQQIGIDPQTAIANGNPISCPNASKIGTVEVDTPLLAQYDPENKVQRDPEDGHPLPEPIPGSVYLAQPFDNPFDSLIAIYVVFEDPQHGLLVKLPGLVEPDPQTGRLRATFDDNPQLPFTDFKLHFFGGARGALITPPTCAVHTTTSALTPWSTPEGADAHPSDSFQTTAAPGGGPCPATPNAAPNAPSFTAGTLSAQAGAYSPFVLKLSREDGTARLTGFDTTLPPGLTGRLAGIPACSDTALAQASSRSNPEQGALELANPSCPAASKLGTVDVAAGAGPTPIHTQGTAYLAGPYKGAPLSMAVITPAIAGPFDLGTVVVRAALHVDPDTTQIHAVSDPFPTILHGIPLDLRSVAVSLDRPDFTLNPTSCNEMAITGSVTSIFNTLAPLSQRFQVGGCASLPFKPKLTLALKGKTRRTSHPRLIANLTAKPGEANIARAQVKLPKAAFLDQGSIATICTRVQFAVDTCPPGSIYGKASATTPLLDYALAGPVYLRSSTHNLPDLVVKLKGPANQPIEIDLAGRTDAVKGALRNTFEAVPDQPVTKFHLELFGGNKGLIELSAGLCANPKASIKMDGQNGKVHDTRPLVRTSCPKKGHTKHANHKSKN